MSWPRSPWRTSSAPGSSWLMLRPGGAVHELHGQGLLQRGLDRGHQGRGILVAPRRVPAERHPGPVGVVGQAGLVRQAAVGVVDPVPGELAGPGDRVLGPAVGVQGERQRGPHQRRLPLDEGPPAHRPGHGHGRPAAGGLDEAHPRLTPLGLALDVGQRDRLEGVAQADQLELGHAHQPAAVVAAAGDAAGVVDLDPGPQHVREAEPVRRPQLLDVGEPGGRRVVVVREPGVERRPAGAGDGFGRDPGQ